MYYVVTFPKSKNPKEYKVLDENEFNSCKKEMNFLFKDVSKLECHIFIDSLKESPKSVGIYDESRLNEKATDFSMEKYNSNEQKFNIDKYNGFVAGYKQAMKDLLIVS